MKDNEKNVDGLRIERRPRGQKASRQGARDESSDIKRMVEEMSSQKMRCTGCCSLFSEHFA